MDIFFVHLGIGISNLQKTFSVFGFDIAYYGLIIVIGVMAGVAIGSYDAVKNGADLDTCLDLAIYAVIFGVIGARLYYVIFEWDMYKDNLWEIFNIRNGGLAIYGGVIGAAATFYVVTKIKKMSMLKFADSGVLGLLIGQSIGRWGNFVNCEAFGGYTDNLLAMRLNVENVNSSMISAELWANKIVENGITYIQVHPTFFYESMWNLCLLIVLLFYRKHKKFTGEIFCMYLAGYGLGRAWIEGLRTDQLVIGNTGIAVSQLLAGVLFVVFTTVIIVKHVMLKKAANGAPETVLTDVSGNDEGKNGESEE